MIYSFEKWLMHLSLEGQAEQKQMAKELKSQHTDVEDGGHSRVRAEIKNLDDREICGIGCQCHALRSTHLLCSLCPLHLPGYLLSPLPCR